MKFFYAGKLVRTSKTHDYNFGVLNANGKIVSCSATKEGAEKLAKDYFKWYKTQCAVVALEKE